MYISDKEHLQIPLVTSTSIPVSDSSAKPKAGPPITSVNDEINLLSTEVQQHPSKYAGREMR